MHVIWFTAMSMDGRIATAGDSLDFLDLMGAPEAPAESPAPVADGRDSSDFESMLESVDAIIVGASTLRWLVRGGHGWPHGDVPTWLITHDAGLVDAVGPTAQPLRTVSGSLQTAFDEITAAGHERVWLAGGGSVAGQALALDAALLRWVRDRR